ncbi:hypothetical protein [uncultured Ornithinimicrobium sp.]|uniref:hypothetical protein n=1 Tax=uncultured Ornithinimicrobium sp. TaxID=259307 RepID=UPI0025961D1C|nr:hypothetical protein [uncultured Ornithinimicrobium sp.]
MTAEQLLSTEVRYVDADGQEVVTALRKVDPARLARALPVRRTLSRAGQRHYSGLFWSATTRGRHQVRAPVGLVGFGGDVCDTLGSEGARNVLQQG